MTTPGTGGARDYPVALSVEGRPCLVVGAGPVGTRKAAALVGCGALVTVVAPETGKDMDDLLRAAPAGRLRLERRPYRTGEAGGYDVVVAATGLAECDRQVADDAAAGGALVNGPASSDGLRVHLPAVHRQGPVTVAVTTGGTSPALAAWLRDRLAPVVGPYVAVLADLLAEAREGARAAGRATADIDWAAAIEQIAPLVEAGRVDEARRFLAGLCEG